MSTNLIGYELETYTFTIEKGKIKELALAIGDNQKEFLQGERIQPTFPTIIEFRLSQNPIPEQLGLREDKLLHGEQEYEYLGEIVPGDEITLKGNVEDYYIKSNKRFIVIKREFTNQIGELVLISRTTIIEME
ncbi:MaoC family dehydratase N-terminal domain-containing protein [Neobacillus niacini]|uniref:FAS1-like dehydratase domain-containing protein n=1 Tax=Neobacillus niacini TaxID=86668 RepID=UPI002FFDF00F